MTTKTISLSKTAARWALGGFAATAALMAGIQTNAQAIAKEVPTPRTVSSRRERRLT